MTSKNIAKRPDGRYGARYRDDAGREHSKHFDRKVDAKRWLDEVTADVLTGMYVDPRAGKITFGEYAKQWQGSQLHRANTASTVDVALRVHALPRFGERPMASIRQSDIQQWVYELSMKLKPATVKINLSTRAGSVSRCRGGPGHWSEPVPADHAPGHREA